MNLGAIAFQSFLILGVLSGLLSLAIAYLVMRLTRIRELAILCFLLLAPLLAYASNSQFHQRLFVWWQQAQNTVVPKEFPCVDYEPGFNSLRAKYKMSDAEFEHWVSVHPWKLRPYTIDAVYNADEQAWLGNALSGKAFATEMEPNGKQLRVYHADDTTYILYYAW